MSFPAKRFLHAPPHRRTSLGRISQDRGVSCEQFTRSGEPRCAVGRATIWESWLYSRTVPFLFYTLAVHRLPLAIICINTQDHDWFIVWILAMLANCLNTIRKLYDGGVYGGEWVKTIDVFYFYLFLNTRVNINIWILILSALIFM